MTKRQPQPAGKKSQLPGKIDQPHGGAIYAGGVPGHDGSRAGRRRAEVKEMLVTGAARAVPLLLAQVDGKNPLLAQNAADKLLKYGIGAYRDDAMPLDELRERVKATIDIIRRIVPVHLADMVLDELHEVWRS